MSAEDMVREIAAELSRQNYPLNDESVLNGLVSIFRTFDSDLLIEANKRSEGELFRLVSEVAINASSYRREKFRNQSDLRIAVSDFVPAFVYLGAGPDFEPFGPYWPVLRPPIRRRGIGLSISSWEFIRKSCPWC